MQEPPWALDWVPLACRMHHPPQQPYPQQPHQQQHRKPLAAMAPSRYLQQAPTGNLPNPCSLPRHCRQCCHPLAVHLERACKLQHHSRLFLWSWLLLLRKVCSKPSFTSNNLTCCACHDRARHGETHPSAPSPARWISFMPGSRVAAANAALLYSPDNGSWCRTGPHSWTCITKPSHACEPASSCPNPRCDAGLSFSRRSMHVVEEGEINPINPKP